MKNSQCIRGLNKNQLAFRDSDGGMTVLPMDDKKIRESFIKMLEEEFQ